MSRVGPGWCPFAEQIEGVTTFDVGGAERVGFCDHTASGFYSTLRDASFWNNAGTSVHFAIARDGRIAQIANIFDTAFAQGRLGPNPSWPKWAEMGQRNPNGYLISTEHEDAITINGETHFVPGSQWTPEQYAADLKVKRWCVEEVGVQTNANLMRFGIDSLAGHHMFDSVNRKECPGRFWRNEYRARLFEDLTQAPAAPRVWAWGNEVAGCEVRGKQLFYWHNGVEIDAVGDYEGNFVGAHYHREGPDVNGVQQWRQVLP